MKKDSAISRIHGKVNRLVDDMAQLRCDFARRSERNGHALPNPANGTPLCQRKLSDIELYAAHLQRATEHLALAVREQILKSLPNAIRVKGDLNRALLLARCPLESAVSMAVTQYLDCTADAKRFAQIGESLGDRERNEMLVRCKRQLENHRRNLTELSVEVRQFEEGSPFDPAYHEVVGQTATADAEKADMIAACETPAFVWRDEVGQQQVTPAKVTVYRAADPQSNGQGKS